MTLLLYTLRSLLRLVRISIIKVTPLVTQMMMMTSISKWIKYSLKKQTRTAMMNLTQQIRF
jgi:hypothetical protein